VLDQIYGIEKRKTAIISPTQIATKVSTHKQSITRATSSLIACNVLVRVGEMEYRFIKDYETWTDGKKPRLSLFEGRYCENGKTMNASTKPGNNGAYASTKPGNNGAYASTKPGNNGAYNRKRLRLPASAPALTPSDCPPDPPIGEPARIENNGELRTSSSSTPQRDEDDEVLNFGRQTMGDRFDLEAIGQQLPGWRAARYPDLWIRDAILIANCNAKPGKVAAYVSTCLRNWQANGGPNTAEFVKAQAKAASMPSGGQNGSGNTITPSQRLKAEKTEPLTREQILESLAELEAKPRKNSFDRTAIQKAREELAKL
jgi:hypothetical protein